MLILGRIKGKRKRGQQRMRWSDSITDLMDLTLSKLWEVVKDWEAWHAAVHGVAMSHTWLRDQTTIIMEKKRMHQGNVTRHGEAGLKEWFLNEVVWEKNSSKSLSKSRNGVTEWAVTVSIVRAHQAEGTVNAMTLTQKCFYTEIKSVQHGVECIWKVLEMC